MKHLDQQNSDRNDEQEGGGVGNTDPDGQFIDECWREAKDQSRKGDHDPENTIAKIKVIPANEIENGECQAGAQDACSEMVFIHRKINFRFEALHI
jgi:hypothetical protein